MHANLIVGNVPLSLFRINLSQNSNQKRTKYDSSLSHFNLGKRFEKREYMNRRKEFSISKICLSSKQFKRDMMFINWIG